MNARHSTKPVRTGVRKSQGLLCTLLIAAGLSAVPLAQSVASERVRWQVPTGAPTTLPGADAIVHASKSLTGMSGGSITLRIYEPGELIPPFEVSDAVGEGRYPAGFTYTAYDEGSMPASPLFSTVPFAMDPVGFSSWHYVGGGKELLNEMYHERNIHALLCGITGPQLVGWFRQSITSIEDFDGLTIRFPGIGAHVLSRLGANISMIPAGDTYQALERGVVDAAKLGQPAVGRAFGFHEIAPYYMLPDWAQPNTTTHLMINKDVWDGLEDTTKHMLETACMAATMLTLVDTEKRQAAVLREFDELGITPLVLPDEDLRKIRDISNEVLDEMAADDEFFARVLESQRAFAEEYSEWAERGYLPSGVR
ncbi:MAG: TRAP transporter substrate-binding protein [Ectothiorhodospiraceae bacterium]|nr:TRAP transporter substrate-binding protein [Ectothiorhodospiraceae bacterium]